MTVSAASPAWSQRCYCDPYVDATSSTAANMSLFALLFPQSRGHDKAHKEVCKQDAPIQTAVNTHQCKVQCAPPLSLGMLRVTEKPNVESLAVDAELQRDVMERNTLIRSTSPHIKDRGSNTVTSSPILTAEETVPVRVQLRELQRRMREQLEVHRGLGTALQQLDTLAKEVQVFRAEQRTEALVATLRERQAKAFAHILPCETNNGPPQAAGVVATRPLPTTQSHTAAQPTTTTTTSSNINADSSNNNVLQDILRTYASSPRSPRLRSPAFPSPTSATSAPTTTTANAPVVVPRTASRVEIVRPPPAPQPYLRVRYIAVHRPATENTDNNIVRRESVSAAPSEYTEDFHSSAAVDSVKTSNGLVSSPASTRRRSGAVMSHISSTAATTAITASLETTTTTATSSSSSVRSSSSELMKTSTASSSSISTNRSSDASSAQEHKKDEVTVQRAFEAFTAACGNANRLVRLLTQTQQGQSTQTHHREHITYNRNVLQRDLHDLRRLQHFTRKLQRNVHVLDVQRRLVRAKRRELVHARLLARARRELQRRPHARLHDVVDELSVSSVASSVGAELKQKLFFARNKTSHGSANDEIEDEVSVALSGSLNSIEDEYDSSMHSITDEVIDGSEYDVSTSSIKGHVRGSRRRRMSGTDSIEDEVDVQNTSALSPSDHATTVEDAGGSVGLESVEEDFASLLASASVIDSVIDSIPSDLPSHSATTISSHSNEVLDEIVTEEGTAVNITNDSDSEVSDEAEGIDDVIRSEGESSRSYTPPHTDTSIASSTVQTSTAHVSTSHSVPSSVPSEVEVESAATRGGAEHDSVSSSEERYSTRNKTRTGNDRVDLSELRVQLAQTQRRRRRALRRVQVPRFSELYDPNASSVSSSLLASSTTRSSSSQRSMKSDDVGLLSQGMSVVASVLAEQDAWKQREKELIRQLLA